MNGSGNPTESESADNMATPPSQPPVGHETAYDFRRTDSRGTNASNFTGASDSYYNAGASSITGHGHSYYGRSAGGNGDATETVHEMHLALLYLLSNPEEFKKAIHAHPPQGATTLSEWNAEYEYDDDDEESVLTSGTAAATPLPFVVFADDAEVVLPQAHTASQLFGIEQVEGIELEAAAGIPALSQLFLRWLALMPGGDHLNIIDPPGLTVMRIAGGRYRVTGAHRVVWTWMNEFASIAEEDSSPGGTFDNTGSVNNSSSPMSGSERQQTQQSSQQSRLQMEDLVSLVIVDVFETDNQGRLLSYCPTFDNRAVQKTNKTSETLRKSSSKFFSMLGRAQKAVAKSDVTKKASAQLSKMEIGKHAKNVAESMIHRVDEAVHSYNSPSRKQQPQGGGEAATDLQGFEEAISTAAEEAVPGTTTTAAATTPASSKPANTVEEEKASPNTEAEGFPPPETSKDGEEKDEDEQSKAEI